MIDKETYRELYRKLDEVFPVPYDCGTICGKACCGVAEYNRATRDEDMGLYLYPGEDELLKEDADWLNWSEETVEEDDIAEIVSSWTGIPVSRMTQSEAERLIHLEAQLAVDIRQYL